jgi:hypothetical protein
MPRLLLSTLLLSLACFVASCGKSDSPETGEDTSPPAPAPEAVAETQEEPVAPPAELPLKERAEAGDADACYEYGMEFEKAGDADTAFTWFKRAAREKHVEGTYKVGTYYHEGIATEPDLAKARRCYVIASKADHAGAKKALVDMVLQQEKHAKHERKLTDEEFEGMSVQQALPLIKEKAMREVKKWQETPEYEALLEQARTRLYETYGIDPKYVEVADYQPLSLLKRQIETKLQATDVNALVEERFSDEAKAEAEQLAATDYPSANVGDTVTVNSRRGEVTGQIQSMDDREIRISGTTILLNDVSADERRKLDPEYIRKGRTLVMNEHFYVPRAEYEEELRTAIEDDVMLDAGYVFHNGKWGTTAQMLEFVVNPNMKKAMDSITRNKASEYYRAILERNGFTVVGDNVMTLAEKEALIQQHTAAITATQQQIAAMLPKAKSPQDFTNAINLANQALGRYVLATNRDSLMRARAALVQGKAKLTGIIEHQQHLARVGKQQPRTVSKKPKRPTFTERPGGRNADRRDKNRDAGKRAKGRNFSNSNKLSF